MQAHEVLSRPRCELMRRPEARSGWANAGLAMAACEDLAISQVVVRLGRLPRLRQAIADWLGVELPAPMHVSRSDRVIVVPCGPARYLIVSAPGDGQLFAAELEHRLGEFAVVVDLSDCLVPIAIDGRHALDLVERLCGVDLRSGAPHGTFGLAARLLQVRAYLWRTAPTDPVIVAISRSVAVSTWDRLLIAAGTV